MKMQSQKTVFVWGSLLLVLGIARLIYAFIPFSTWMWIIILTVIGGGAFCVYLTERSDWSFLIPPYLMWSIAGLLILHTADLLQYKDSAIYVLPVIAFPFGMAFVRNHTRWWALMLTYIFLTIAVLVGFIGLGVLSYLSIAAYVLLTIAIPFLAIYARNRRHWWPLVPGGVFAIIGMALLIAATPIFGSIGLFIAGGWILTQALARRKGSNFSGKSV